METPSSTTRRVTRSQALAALSTNTNNNNIPISRKIEDSSEKGVSKSRTRTNNNAKQPLIDITNDSPIVGVASGSLETPSSKVTKQRSFKRTPGSGSGETLLRGQVKTLLQRVEEEAELSKLSMESRPFLHLVNSPMRLLAPTPANTPQILNLDDKNNGLALPSPVVQEQLIYQQVVSDIFDGKKVESIECDKNLTRSLLFDFSEKLELSNSSSTSECSSVVTDQGGVDESSKEKSTLSPDDDVSSIWSIQGNASSSTHDEDEEDVNEEEDCDDNYDDDDYADEEEEDEGGLLDELCEGVSRISMAAEFKGKHTRFMYNSDGEIVEKECEAGGLSPSVLRLQGLPTPKGKHLRFPLEEDASD